MAEVALPGGRVASYQVIGSGRPALMLAGGPGFAASYMTGPDADAREGGEAEAEAGALLDRHAGSPWYDLDYRVTVLADGCLDADPKVHRVLTEKVFPRQADVVRIADWTASLATMGAG
jgi:hypothetical protein